MTSPTRPRLVLVAALAATAEAKLPRWDPEFFQFSNKQVGYHVFPGAPKKVVVVLTLAPCDHLQMTHDALFTTSSFSRPFCVDLDGDRSGSLDFSFLIFSSVFRHA